MGGEHGLLPGIGYARVMAYAAEAVVIAVLVKKKEASATAALRRSSASIAVNGFNVKHDHINAL
jgi:ribosomal protein S9